MLRVMIVDDEYIVRLGIASVLDWGKYGYVICGTATDGTDALEKIETLHPDIILADIMMHPMDGLTLLEECSHRYPNIRFIMLSNYTEFHNVKRAMQLGACDYIFKLEISEEELLNSLKSVPLNQEQDNMPEDTFFTKHNLLESLLSGEKISSPHIVSLLNKLNIQLDFSGYRILVLQLDVFAAKNEGSFSLTRAMQSIIEQFMPPIPGYICAWYKDLKFVLYIPDKRSLEFYRNMFIQISDYTTRYLSGKTIGALSPVIDNSLHLPQVFEQTHSMLDQYFYHPTERFFITKREFQEKFDKQRFQDFSDKLSHSILHDQPEYCIKILDQVLQSLKELNLIPDLIKEATITIFENAWLVLIDRLENKGISNKSFSTPNLQDLRQSVNFQELKENSGKILNDLCAWAENTSYSREILLAKEYIKDNLNKKITLPLVAQHVNISESYFSHLFKKETGTNFIDYVNELKIERAKMLLSQTLLKVNEISIQVGFDNANYFNILFKRLAGVSPGNYRELNTQSSTKLPENT